MSFFNLTMLGHENVLKEYKQNKPTETSLPPIFTSYGDANTIYAKPLNSNLRYQELRTKHIRHPKEPSQLFTRPVTDQQKISWWTADSASANNFQWAHVKRHVFPKSEMTAFAHSMCLADKSFRMY